MSEIQINNRKRTHALDRLIKRGFYRQCTDEIGLRNKMAGGSIKFYVGIDPTASSLHIGHLVPLYAAAHLQREGHKPIILMGGGTARIGDPSGKTRMRRLLDYRQIDENIKKIIPQIARIIDFDKAGVLLGNNADWLASLNYIAFLRDIGRHFSVNRMLGFETYKQRMAKGLSFLELNYQLLQSYDFLELWRREECLLQVGGNDQWGNIVAGVELIRRVAGVAAYGLTFPLLTRSDGRKMGKTEKGALFLDPAITPVYEFYQYWRNVPDQDVENLLLIFTFLPEEECRRLGSAKGTKINSSKERLAYEVTSLLHGKDEALNAQEAARAVFSNGKNKDGVPSRMMPKADFEAGISIVDLLAQTDLCNSKSEARRLVLQGGAGVNGKRVGGIDTIIGLSDVIDGELLLRAGKKRHFRIAVTE